MKNHTRLFLSTVAVAMMLVMSMLSTPDSAHAAALHPAHVYTSYSGSINEGTTLYGSSYDYVYDNSYNLKMQADGNLVLYRNSGGTVWANGKNGSGGSGATYRAILQNDGNFVEYCMSGSCGSQRAVWSTSTFNTGGQGTRLTIEFESAGTWSIVILAINQAGVTSCGSSGLCKS